MQGRALFVNDLAGGVTISGSDPQPEFHRLKEMPWQRAQTP
jgi:hypothetical protein